MQLGEQLRFGIIDQNHIPDFKWRLSLLYPSWYTVYKGELKSMDIREYTYILAIINYGSFSKAAKALYISQPSLSIYIKNLEKRLNITFFEDRKLTLTQEGKVYIDYAKKIVQLNIDLQDQLNNMAKYKNSLVRIGITATRGSYILPKLFPLLQKEHPEIQIKITEDISEELENMVLGGELDFIMVNYPFKEHALKFIKLYDEEIVVAVSKDNPIIKKAIPREDTRHLWIDIRDMKEEPFILLKRGQKMRQIADSVFQEAGYLPHIILETGNAVTAFHLSCTGIGSTILIDTFINSEENIALPAFLSIGTPRLNRELVLAFAPNRRISSAAGAVINTIQTYVTTLGLS